MTSNQYNVIRNMWTKGRFVDSYAQIFIFMYMGSLTRYSFDILLSENEKRKKNFGRNNGK